MDKIEAEAEARKKLADAMAAANKMFMRDSIIEATEELTAKIKDQELANKVRTTTKIFMSLVEEVSGIEKYCTGNLPELDNSKFYELSGYILADWYSELLKAHATKEEKK